MSEQCKLVYVGLLFTASHMKTHKSLLHSSALSLCLLKIMSKMVMTDEGERSDRSNGVMNWYKNTAGCQERQLWEHDRVSEHVSVTHTSMRE